MIIVNAYSIYMPECHLHRRLHGTYYGPARPNGVRNAERITTTPVVKASADGRTVITASGSKYRLRVTAPKEAGNV